MSDAPAEQPSPRTPADPEEFMLKRWQNLRITQPQNGMAIIGIGRSLAALGRFDELIDYARQIEPDHPGSADWVLRFGSRVAPADTALGIEYCEAATRRGDTDKALKRWDMLRRRQPSEQAVHLGYIEALLAAGKVAAAARAVDEALGQLGGFEPIRAMQARVQQALQDAPKPEAAIIPSIASDDRKELEALVMNFQSLGANCEFGLLQRKFGAEPLGLLRFSGTSPPTLVHLLRSRFEGFGTVEAMRIAHVGDEIRLGHVHSGWTMHIPYRDSPDDLDKLLREQTLRVGYLKRELIGDLEDGEKIFVYARAELPDARIAEIHTALRAYGPPRLLCVRLPTVDQPQGEIRFPRDGLMVASLDRFGIAFPGSGWDISVDHWAHFCRVALAHFGGK